MTRSGMPLIVLIVLAFVVSACGDQPPSQEPGAGSEPPESEAAKH